MAFTRRTVCMMAISSSVGALGVGTAQAQSSICYDPDSLTLSQKSRRKSLGYVETAESSERSCAHCMFYTSDNSDCGQCQLLGGPVRAAAVCTSFAKGRSDG